MLKKSKKTEKNFYDLSSRKCINEKRELWLFYHNSLTFPIRICLANVLIREIYFGNWTFIIANHLFIKKPRLTLHLKLRFLINI